MTNIQQDYALLEAHESLLLPLLQGAQPVAGELLAMAGLAEHQEQALQLWLKAALNRSAEPHDLDGLPTPQAQRWRGWLAYFQGHYAVACEHFIDGFEQVTLQQVSPVSTLLQGRFSLGLAKVYTRTGHWNLARDWVMHSIALARQCNSTLDIVKGYGALGELLLRGGYPRDALFCLGTARELLPAGASERARQWNYLASALMRLGTSRDQLAAESLLMSSYYLAMDAADHVSAVHALARLQFLELDRLQSRDLPKLLQCPGGLLDSGGPQSVRDSVPYGFLDLGRAFAAWRRGEEASALQLAEHASHCLRHVEAEQKWAQALCSQLRGQYAPHETGFNLRVSIYMPPTSTAVLDNYWLRPSLTDAGHSHFLPPEGDLELLLKHRQVFFL